MAETIFNTKQNILNEANRCLLCKKARCSGGCPVQTDVATCIKLYKEGKIIEAGEILFNNNPFSIITSRVCNWVKLCYGNCILNHKKVPIQWYLIEQEISDNFLFQFHPQEYPYNDKKICIIGAGPTGLTAAIKLREAGYQVDIYESKEKLGGVLMYGIPEFRLDKKYISEYERIIKEYNINIYYSTNVGKDISLDQLRKKYDAILIATGAWEPRKMKIKGENSPNVIYALEYLENPQKYKLGKKVIVIGGGNVTMDAARTAKRQGCDTYIYYRKTFENMPANALEIKDTQEDGVKFILFEVPVAIKNDNIAIMAKCENIIQEDGRITTRTIPNSEYEVSFDSMIIAISENVDYSIFGENKPSFNEKGWVWTDGSQKTSFDNVFIAGDFILGPSTVVESIQSAKVAVDGIISYLSK